jgi:hypothetical protein
METKISATWLIHTQCQLLEQKEIEEKIAIMPISFVWNKIYKIQSLICSLESMDVFSKKKKEKQLKIILINHLLY